MAYGKLKVDKLESSGGGELTLPTSAGSSGQVLTTDGSGVLSFTTSTANTNLSVTANDTSLTVESSSGDNTALPAASSTSWGVMTDEDKSKLDLIEPLSTADQTDAEIRAAVGAATDSNIFTDADHLKLNGIEASAEANQTGAEIKTAYEAQSDTNAFTDADHTKLDGIETSATADQTNAEIRAAVEAATDSNVFTDADHTKLDGISASANNYAISADLLDEDDFASDSSTKAASQQSIKAYVDTEVAGLVDSAPASLDTLNELSQALGADSNFSTTVTNSIAAKLELAGGMMTGALVLSGSPTSQLEAATKQYVDGIWDTSSAAATMVSSKRYLTDTSGAAFTLTLPASAIAGDFVSFADPKGTFSTNSLTIDRNGHNIAGAADDLVANVDRAVVTLIYSGDATTGWLVK